MSHTISIWIFSRLEKYTIGYASLKLQVSQKKKKIQEIQIELQTLRKYLQC